MSKAKFRLRSVANIAALASVPLFIGSTSSPATAQNYNCVDQARQICIQWDTLGYNSYGDCFQAEFAICTGSLSAVGTASPVLLRSFAE